MKKIIGILCLALAAVGVVSLVKKGAPPPTGNAAYDSGRKVGMYAVPVVFGLLGLWLVTRDSSR